MNTNSAPCACPGGHGVLAHAAAMKILRKDLADPGWAKRLRATDSPRVAYALTSMARKPLTPREKDAVILTAAVALARRTGTSVHRAARVIEQMAAGGAQLPAQNESPNAKQRLPKPWPSHPATPPGTRPNAEPEDTPATFTKFFNLATQIQKQHKDWTWTNCKIEARKIIALAEMP